MTLTLPRFSRRSIITTPAQVTPLPAQISTTTTTKEVLMDVLFEVLLPEGSALPQVDGWTLRLWPQARLGDATLQAHADTATGTLKSLTAALNAQGVTALSLVRRRAA